MEWLRRPPKRRVRPPRLGVAMAILVIVILAARYGVKRPDDPPAPTMAPVERVVDGDTLLLTDRTRVRLIGVDTPETVKPDTPPEPWGKEATEFTREFLRAGQPRFEFDRERTDQYGRTLVYAWVGERLLNEELLRAGLARAELGFHYADGMKARFRRAQKEAQKSHLGIWSAASPAGR